MTQPDDQKTASSTVLQKKLAGVPVWVYAVAAGIMVFLVIYLRRSSSGSSNDSSTDSSNMATEGTIPPFINQVYTNPTPPEASSPTPPSSKPPVIKENRKYKVQKGDTLESISKKFYNKPGEWRVIYDANKSHFDSIMKHRLDPKKKLHGGHTIVIP